jgi:hypothetical protein
LPFVTLADLPATSAIIPLFFVLASSGFEQALPTLTVLGLAAVSAGPCAGSQAAARGTKRDEDGSEPFDNMCRHFSSTPLLMCFFTWLSCLSDRDFR